MDFLWRIGSVMNVLLVIMLLAGLVGVICNRKVLASAGMRRVMEYLFSKKWLVLILCVAYLAANCGAQYLRNDKLPTMQIKLNYSEAAEGLNPNRTRFNESKVLSAEVMEAVVAKAGLKITPEELASGLRIQSAFDETRISADSQMRIATEYKVNTTQKLLSMGVDPTLVLTTLGTVFEEVFLQEYAEDNSIMELTFEDLEGVDYLDRKDYLEMKANKLGYYISTYSQENPSYRLADTGETFDSLTQKIDHFVNIDLERYKSFVLENGLSKNSAQYINQMDYENLQLNVDHQKQMAAYNVRLEAINLYDEKMAQIVLVPTTDYNKQFYMSRTRIGVLFYLLGMEITPMLALLFV